MAVIVACVTLALFALGLTLWGMGSYRAPGPLSLETRVEIPRGAGVKSIAKRLHTAGAIRHPWLFKAAVKVTGAATELKAGEYALPAQASTQQIIALLRAGQTIRYTVTIPEGWTAAQIGRALMAIDILQGQVAELPEGTLLPATYEYRRGEQRASVQARMVAERERVLAELWPQRAPDLPVKTPEEAMILASVVEKETAVASERPRVAAVFVNRLNRGMRLESDPTIIYGLNGGEPLGRGLRRSEIDAPNPYNTYYVDGLPAGPICNPGRESIAAVLNPARTNDLFFVADGTGGHTFSETYEQHKAAVARWRLIENAR